MFDLNLLKVETYCIQYTLYICLSDHQNKVVHIVFYRFNVPNLCILLTDGVSNEDEDQTLLVAQQAKDEGIEIISIGIGYAINEEEIKDISSAPHELNKNYFTTPTFYALANIKNLIIDLKCYRDRRFFCHWTYEAGTVCFCRNDRDYCDVKPMTSHRCIGKIPDL